MTNLYLSFYLDNHYLLLNLNLIIINHLVDDLYLMLAYFPLKYAYQMHKMTYEYLNLSLKILKHD